MLTLLLLTRIAGAAPLDVPREAAIKLLTDCAGGDATACLTMAASANRAWAASVVDNAFGNDDVALYRATQATALIDAACTAGHASACNWVGDPLRACAAGDDVACRTVDAPIVPLLATLNARRAADANGAACERLDAMGWRGGTVTRATAYPSHERWQFGGDGALFNEWFEAPNAVWSPEGARQFPIPAALKDALLRGPVTATPGGIAVAVRAPVEPHPTTAIYTVDAGVPRVVPITLPPATPLIRAWTALPGGLLVAVVTTYEDQSTFAQAIVTIDPVSGAVTPLLDLPADRNVRINSVRVGGGQLVFASKRRVSRAVYRVDAAGVVTLGDATDLQTQTFASAGGDVPEVRDAAVGDDGGVWIALGSAACLRWGSGPATAIAECQAVEALSGGRAALLVGKEVHIVDATGAVLGRVQFPNYEVDGITASTDGNRISLTTRWSDRREQVLLDLGPVAPMPTWPQALPLVADHDGSRPGGPMVSIVARDSAGIPLAGLPVWLAERTTDALGRVTAREGAKLPEATFQDYVRTTWRPLLSGGLDLPASPVNGVLEVRTLAEARARREALGPGVTIATAADGIKVLTVDPWGLWAGTLEAGDVLTLADPEPAGGWTVEAMWAMARARWPLDGLHGTVLRTPTGRRRGGPTPYREDVLIPGGPRCAAPEPWLPDEEFREALCPVAAEVGTHLDPWPAEKWAGTDLVGLLPGHWQEEQVQWDELVRAQARVRAVLHGRSDPGGSVNAADDVRVASILHLLGVTATADIAEKEQFLADELERRPAPVTRQFKRSGVPGTVSLDGAVVKVEAMAGTVFIGAEPDAEAWVFADPDTLVDRRGHVLRRVR